MDTFLLTNKTNNNFPSIPSGKGKPASAFAILKNAPLSKDARFNIQQSIFQPGITIKENSLAKGLPDGIINLIDQTMSAPAEWETSIELPCLLLVSPLSYARWKHTLALSFRGRMTNNRIYELWHTHMGVPVSTRHTDHIDDGGFTAGERLFRVLWGYGVHKDFRNIPAAAEVNASMNSRQRHALVHETSNFAIPNFTPKPVVANKLFLTAMGGYLDSLFTIDQSSLDKADPETKDNGQRLGLLKWRHIQTLGREHYVEIVETGYIMPFGHKASKITITERKPHPETLTAINFRRQIVVITEPVKYYNYRDRNGNFMQFCFNQVELLTTSTHLLDLPLEPIQPGTDAFALRSNGKDILFDISAEDWNGNIVDFQMPLVFIQSPAKNSIEACKEHLFSTNFKGQKLSLAPAEKDSFNTAFPAYNGGFTLVNLLNTDLYDHTDEPQGFLPVLGETEITEPSYQRLTGNEIKTNVWMVDDNSDAGIFARLSVPQAVQFNSQADKTGGFAVPNFRMTALSKTAGAVGGNLLKVGDGSTYQLDPTAYFQVPDAPDYLTPVLFGVFKLSDVLETLDSNQLPQLITTETEDDISTIYNLTSSTRKWSNDFVSFEPVDKNLSVTTTIIAKKIQPKEKLTAPQFSTIATMGAFGVAIMNLGTLGFDPNVYLITVHFEKVEFTTSPGKSADINVQMENQAITFGGPLRFLNAFLPLIESGGFSDPPYLDVSDTGVKCGYTTAIPSVQVGAFTLSNLSLGADVNLPFTGAPMMMGFRFCEKQQPFTLTVSLLGGGGYVGFEVDLHGLRQIDAALEFGASASLNLGVASGAATIMAGIYFKMEAIDSNNNSTRLTGYLRINGALCIIGLITAAIELYMAFTYLIAGNKAYGEAEVSIKVHVAFFSKSVRVHTSRTFSGDGSDPNFEDTYTLDSWQTYCDAFVA